MLFSFPCVSPGDLQGRGLIWELAQFSSNFAFLNSIAQLFVRPHLQELAIAGCTNPSASSPQALLGDAGLDPAQLRALKSSFPHSASTRKPTARWASPHVQLTAFAALVHLLSLCPLQAEPQSHRMVEFQVSSRFLLATSSFILGGSPPRAECCAKHQAKNISAPRNAS